MNKQRREAIAKLADRIDGLREEIEALRDEEQEYFDNMPESLQGGEKGDAAEAAISSLEDAMGALVEATDHLRYVTEA